MLCLGCNNHVADNDCVQLDGGWYCNECTGICSCCEDAFPADDIRFVDGENYCDSCFDDKFVECYDCGKVLRQDDAVYSDCSDAYCESCYSDQFSRCECCDSETDTDDIICTENGACLCQSCYDEKYINCYECGCEVPRDEAICVGHHDYCDSCATRDKLEWSSGVHRRNRVIDRIRSTRKYGVELETSSCPDHADLEDDTIFGCCEDGSIAGMEFVSPVLADDNGLDVVADFCRRANRSDFTVNDDCGYHLHIDMSDESIDSMKSVAFAYNMTYDVWSRFVDDERRDNKYCKANSWEVSKLAEITCYEDFRGWAFSMDRRQWFNVCAYNRHKTFEIRLHGGSLDGEKVCNWIKAHTRFADWAASHSIDEISEALSGTRQDRFDALSDIWSDAELTEYYAGRACKFGRHFAVREYA